MIATKVMIATRLIWSMVITNFTNLLTTKNCFTTLGDYSESDSLIGHHELEKTASAYIIIIIIIMFFFRQHENATIQSAVDQ